LFPEFRSNTIGGATSGERNIISGNDSDGVGIINSSGNIVKGNYIGTDVTGTIDLGNSFVGIAIIGGESNTIGGTTAGERNIISGNDRDGVFIVDAGTNSNKVSGNYIGTDVNGTTDLGNSFSGVVIGSGAQSNTIGGTTAGERNIISGNDLDGVFIADAGTNSNKVSGNYIGTDFTGTADLGNSSHGVQLCCGAQSNTIGGTTTGERNIISGNNGAGIWIRDSGTDNNKVSGNYIGTDVHGTAALGNSLRGVRIGEDARFNVIGGTTSGERNIISGNNAGVWIETPGTNNNLVSGNYIGTDVNGTADLGNSSEGVAIVDGAQSNTIGGTGAGEENIIAFNDGNGVSVSDTDTDFNKISGNSIHDNGGLGIDLANSGNDEIAAPTIQSNNLTGNTLTISGDSAGANASVEIFKADSSSTEGEVYLGSLTADGSGNFSGNLDVTGKGLSVGDPLVGTTTHTTNNTSEFSFPDTTLPVELSRFTASSVDGGVRLRWRTETETHNLGFNLYRSELVDGPYTLVNASLIPGAGTDATPHDYSLIDEGVTPGKTYFYYIENVDFEGNTDESHIIRVKIDREADGVQPGIIIKPIPTEFALLQNYPNPFNPETWIPYDLAADASVTIVIYDASGIAVRAVSLGHQPAGAYRRRDRAVYWDGRANNGEPVSSGVYFYHLTASDFYATKKMLILK